MDNFDTTQVRALCVSYPDEPRSDPSTWIFGGKGRRRMDWDQAVLEIIREHYHVQFHVWGTTAAMLGLAVEAEMRDGTTLDVTDRVMRDGWNAMLERDDQCTSVADLRRPDYPPTQWDRPHEGRDPERMARVIASDAVAAENSPGNIAAWEAAKLAERAVMPVFQETQVEVSAAPAEPEAVMLVELSNGRSVPLDALIGAIIEQDSGAATAMLAWVWSHIERSGCACNLRCAVRGRLGGPPSDVVLIGGAHVGVAIEHNDTWSLHIVALDDRIRIVDTYTCRDVDPEADEAACIELIKCACAMATAARQPALAA